MTSKKPETYLGHETVEKCKAVMQYRATGKTFTWIAKTTGWFKDGDQANSWLANYTKAHQRHNTAGKESYKYRFRTPNELRRTYAINHQIPDDERKEINDRLEEAIQNKGKMYPPSTIYALYQGEKNLADGTIYQIAKKMGMSVALIKWYRSPSYFKRLLSYKYSKRKGHRYLVEIEEGD